MNYNSFDIHLRKYLDRNISVVQLLILLALVVIAMRV